MNRNTLKGAMAAQGLTQRDLARILHISENTMSAKLNGKSPFKLGEAQLLCRLLHLPPAVFFTHSVPKKEREEEKA